MGLKTQRMKSTPVTGNSGFFPDGRRKTRRSEKYRMEKTNRKKEPIDISYRGENNLRTHGVGEKSA